MLTKFLKIILGVFISFLFIILLLITFNSKESNSDLIELKKLNLSSNYEHQINDIDNIYTNNKSNFIVKKDTGNETVILKKGEFILSMNDLSKKYNITSTGFNIDLKIPGDIYISTIKTNNIILSINSIIEINFLDSQNNKVNSIFLYPHEYFIFNPKFNSISFKGSDIYRLRILNQVKNNYNKPYIKYKLSDLKQKSIGKIISTKGYEIFNAFMKNKQEYLNNNRKNYDKILQTKSSNFPLRDFIRENYKYFLNNNKKIFFIKNEIYNLLLDLFKQNNFSKKKIEKIISLKEELRKLDNNVYNEINIFNNELYFILLYDNNLKESVKLENFLYLREGKSNLDISGNFLKLKKIYINYDFYNGTRTVKFFKNFLDNYLLKSGIVEKKENFLINKKEKLNEVESFIFYLKEYIDAHLFINKSDESNIENQILLKYFSLNKMIYFLGNQDQNKTKTSLIENKKLLIKLEYFLRNNFFKEKRDKNDLLVINEGNIKLDNILQLEKIINKIFDLFKDFKENLNNDIVDEYKLLNIKFKEEFFALKDYDNYVIERNKEIRKLIDTKGLGAKTMKSYSKNDILNYLKQFNQIYFSENEIIKKENRFEIKKVKIYDKYYEFILYPHLQNKLDIYNIKNENKFSYNLDEQKFLWEDKFKAAKMEEKYKYDFKNFFVLKFNNKFIKRTQEINDEYCKLQKKYFDSKNKKCIDIIDDEPIIATFKQNKLLDEEFNITNKFFLVKYKNLDVRQIDGGEYYIRLNDVKTIINYKDTNNRNNKYELFVSANYDFKNHSLYNIAFKIENNEKILFDGKPIAFSKFKKIKLLGFKEYLISFLRNDIKPTINVFNILRNNFILYDLNIKAISPQITISFNNGIKNTKIKFEKDKIISIIIEGIEILEESVLISDLKNYINKMR